MHWVPHFVSSSRGSISHSRHIMAPLTTGEHQERCPDMLVPLSSLFFAMKDGLTTDYDVSFASC